MLMIKVDNNKDKTRLSYYSEFFNVSIFYLQHLKSDKTFKLP